MDFLFWESLNFLNAPQVFAPINENFLNETQKEADFTTVFVAINRQRKLELWYWDALIDLCMDVAGKLCNWLENALIDPWICNFAAVPNFNTPNDLMFYMYWVTCMYSTLSTTQQQWCLIFESTQWPLGSRDNMFLISTNRDPGAMAGVREASIIQSNCTKLRNH